MTPRSNAGFILILLTGFSGIALPVDAATGLAAVWNYIADSQPVEGQAALRQAGMIDPRERALAGVIVALARPPVAAGRIPEFDSILAGLAIGADDISAQALYLRARLHQAHPALPNHVRVGGLYRELARRWPASHWAQLGLVKMGLIQLYALPGPADPADRLAEVESILGAIAEPALRRDLQLQIGWAGLFYDRPLDEVLPHLVAADRTGGLLGIIPEDLVLQIGELSRRAGHVQQARTYFERFLREFPVSTRRYHVRQRLAELDQPEGKAGNS